MSVTSTSSRDGTSSDERTARIRQLNDHFRTKLEGGRLLLTRGVAGRPDTEQILSHVVNFTEFNNDNDPYGEHDFGAFDLNGERYFFKIDYYTPTLDAGSPDPTDAHVTTRVLTVMRASEY